MQKLSFRYIGHSEWLWMHFRGRRVNLNELLRDPMNTWFCECTLTSMLVTLVVEWTHADFSSLASFCKHNEKLIVYAWYRSLCPFAIGTDRYHTQTIGIAMETMQHRHVVKVNAMLLHLRFYTWMCVVTTVVPCFQPVSNSQTLISQILQSRFSVQDLTTWS